MRPLSALYYIKENKMRSFIIIFMLFLTTFLFIAGNYIDSIEYYWERAEEYSNKICVVTAVSTDEDFKEFGEFYQDICNDEKLTVMDRTSRGFWGLDWISTMGFETGSSSFVFSTPEDMKTVFDNLGIECDFSDIKDRSVVMSSALAAQYDLKKGDIVNEKLDDNISGDYTLDAIIDDNSYILFYVIPNPDTQILRANIISDEMSGDELRNYVNNIKGDRKVHVSSSLKENLDSQLDPFVLIFYTAIILLSAVLSVIVNSVITGQYIKRTYEFGVYRAIGISKAGVYKKCTAEILLMNVIAIVFGAAIIMLLSYMLNELLYIPSGKYLPYYSEIGLKGFLLSNLLVVIPTVLLKGRGMSRADVTEF